MKSKVVVMAAVVLALAMIAQAQMGHMGGPASGPASRPGGPGMPGMHGGPGMMGGPGMHGGPGMMGGPAGAGPARKPEMIKATYLGVGAVPTEPALREQLSLPEGVGLLVDHLDPEGPAKAAGVEQMDVLHKFNDQILINPEQLKVLVRISKPGDEVKLTVIRKAKPQVIDVKLTEKEMPKMPPMMPGMMPGMGGMMPGMPGGMGMPPGMNPEMMERMMREKMQEMMRREHAPDGAMPGRPGPGGPGGEGMPAPSGNPRPGPRPGGILAEP